MGTLRARLLPWVVVCATTVFCQSYSRRYDVFEPGETQFGWSVEHDQQGGFFAICVTVYQDSTYYGPAVGVLRIDANGTALAEHISWVPAAFNYPGWSNCSDPTTDGGFIVAGSITNGVDTDKVCLYRFNTLGLPVGEQVLNLPGASWIGRQAKQTPDGGFVICGETSSVGFIDAFLIKTDSLFNVQWYQTYGFPNRRDYCPSVALGPNGGYYLGGHREITFDNFDQWVLRVDSVGDVIWQDTYGIPNYDDGPNAHIESLADGNCVFGSSWNLTGNGEGTLCMVKIDTAGGVIWSHTYGGWCAACSLFAVKEITPGGDLISCGQAWSYTDDGEQGVLLRVNSAGDSLWQRNYFYYDSLMSDGQGTLRDVLPTADGGFIAVGQVYWSASGNNPPGYNPDLWVVKVDSMGCLEPGCHLITGLQSQATNLRDVFTVAPNPASDVARLAWELPDALAGSAQLSVVSAAGQLVNTFPFAIAHKSLTLDVTAYPAGLYHLHLVVDGQWVSGCKMIVE